MAEKKIIISEILCFIRNKKGIYSDNKLIEAVCNFYLPVNITAAKEQLLEDVKSLNLVNIPRPRRSCTEDKVKMDVTDMLSIFQQCSRVEFCDKMPIYVAMDLDKLPQCYATEGELKILKVSIDNIVTEQKMAAIDTNKKIDLLIQQLSTLQSKFTGNKVQSMNEQITATTSFVINETNSIQSHGPLDTDNNTQSSHMETTDGEGELQVVRNSRKTKKRKKGHSPPEVNRTQPCQPITTEARSVTLPIVSNSRRTICFLGKKTIFENENSKIKASRSFQDKVQKKSVFYVGNVANTYEDKDVRAHLNDLDIDCISCFEIKNKHAAITISKNSKTFTNAKSFRVCVAEEDSDKFLKLDDWPDSVIIRAWVFKPKLSV
jgi:hypothetical protein